VVRFLFRNVNTRFHMVRIALCTSVYV